MCFGGVLEDSKLVKRPYSFPQTHYFHASLLFPAGKVINFRFLVPDALVLD
jgi:hypothetical protein